MNKNTETIEFKLPESFELNKMVDEWFVMEKSSPFLNIETVDGGEEGEINVVMHPDFAKKVTETFGKKEEAVLGDYIGGVIKSFLSDMIEEDKLNSTN